MEQILSMTGDRRAYFGGTHGGAELDLLLEAKGRLWGVEFKYADAPKLTASMRSALSDLNLKKLWVVHPGMESYPLADKVDVFGLDQLPSLFQQLS